MNKYLLIALRAQVKDLAVSGLARLDEATMTVNVQGLNIGGMGSTGFTAYIIHRDGKVVSSPLERMPGGYTCRMQTAGRVNAVAVAGLRSGAPTMLLLGAPAGEYLDAVRIRELVLGLHVEQKPGAKSMPVPMPKPIPVPELTPKSMPMPEPMPKPMPKPMPRPMPMPPPMPVPMEEEMPQAAPLEEEEIPMPSPQGMLGNTAAASAFCPECGPDTRGRGGSLAAQNYAMHHVPAAPAMGFDTDMKEYTFTRRNPGEDVYSAQNYSRGVYGTSDYYTPPADEVEEDYRADYVSAPGYDMPGPYSNTTFEEKFVSSRYDRADHAEDEYELSGEADEVMAYFNTDTEESFDDRTARLTENVYAEDAYDLPVQRILRPQPRPNPPPPPAPAPRPPRPPFPPPRPPIVRPPVKPAPLPVPPPKPTPVPNACVSMPRRFYQGVPTGRLIVNAFPNEYPGVEWLVYRFPTSGNYLRTRFRNPDVECFAIPALPSAYPPAGIPYGARYMMARNGRGYWVFCSC